MPRLATWDRDAVRAIAAGQHDLITAAQLRELHVPVSTMYGPHGVGSMFTLVLPGVHLMGEQRELTVVQRDHAAVLYTGGDAALTGRSMLLRHGIKAAANDAVRPAHRVHVLVSQKRQRASHGFVMVERTWHLPAHIRCYDGVPEVSAARAAMDACRRCSDPEAVLALLTEVIQKGLTTVERLLHELERGQRRGSRFPRQAMEAISGGVMSVPEATFRQGAQARGLTNLLYGPWLYTTSGKFIARPDAYDPETATAAETDSQEFHYLAADWKQTMQRHAWMTANGIAALHFPPSRLTQDLDGCLDEFEQTCTARRGMPPPAIVVRSVA